MFGKELFIRFTVPAALIKKSSNIYFYLFSILITKQNETESIMGKSYSTEHIAEEYIHTDRSTALKRAVRDYFLEWGVKPVLLDPNLALCLCNGSTQRKQ